MKIESVRIENFRSFRDEAVCLNPYSCPVGANGVGRSTVLTALNLFFRDQYSSGPPARADYFDEVTTQPIRVTVTFDDLREREASPWRSR
jgi:putative ATP-dependent endonuclease of the OLD family